MTDEPDKDKATEMIRELHVKEARRRAEYREVNRASIAATVKKAVEAQSAHAKNDAANRSSWSLPECVSWVAWAKFDHMPMMASDGLETLQLAETYERNGARGGGDAVRSEIKAAASKVLIALGRGRVSGYGNSPDGRHGNIPADQWPLLTIDWFANAVRWADGAVAYTDIVLDREALMGETRPAPIGDDPATPAALPLHQAPPVPAQAEATRPAPKKGGPYTRDEREAIKKCGVWIVQSYMVASPDLATISQSDLFALAQRQADWGQHIRAFKMLQAAWAYAITLGEGRYDTWKVAGTRAGRKARA